MLTGNTGEQSAAEWRWPVPTVGESAITSGVGPRWGTTHRGIDITANKDTPVVAAKDGVVTIASSTCEHNYGKKAGTDTCGGGYGNHIYIDHKDGYETRYAHLTTVYVKGGDTVKKGQTIGTVGSTGDSTGYHLHFEVRYKGEVKDPETLVSSTGSAPAPSNPSSDNAPATEAASQYDNSAAFADDYVTNFRVGQLTSQPMHAYVKVSVNGELLVPYNFIQGFEIVRYRGGVGDTATIDIFDDQWSAVESRLAEHYDNVVVEYGYVNSQVKSQTYKMRVSDYSIAFNSTGVELTVKAMADSIYDNLKQQNIILDTNNPTEAVKKISEALGYKVLDKNFDATTSLPETDNPFNVINDNPISYIIDTILPVSSETETMNFYVDNNGYAYFKQDIYDQQSVPRTYIIMKGYDTPVKDFTVDIKGVFGGTTRFGVGSGIRSTVIDPNMKSFNSAQVTADSVITEATGTRIHIDPEQSILSVDTAGSSYTQMSRRLYYDMKNSMSEHYQATLTLVGDPTINQLEYIRIINVTDEGYMHHTSGIYQVHKIIDSVDGGEMTTILTLVRSADIQEGITVISPRSLLK